MPSGWTHTYTDFTDKSNFKKPGVHWPSCLLNKVFTINAEINGESFKAYIMQILLSEVKIFMNIQLGVICAHMVDFYMPGHIYQSFAHRV